MYKRAYEKPKFEEIRLETRGQYLQTGSVITGDSPRYELED